MIQMRLIAYSRHPRRQSSGSSHKRLQRKAVRVEPEAAYHAFAYGRYIRVAAELLTTVHVGDMHLYDGALQRAYAVVRG